MAHPEASLGMKIIELIKLININLNHFPKHEKYGLCQKIRQAAYDVFEMSVECQKRYHKKTTLSTLDIRHEQLRMLLRVAFEMEYFSYHHNRYTRSDQETMRRYLAVSALVNEVGAMIGGWIKSEIQREGH